MDYWKKIWQKDKYSAAMLALLAVPLGFCLVAVISLELNFLKWVVRVYLATPSWSVTPIVARGYDSEEKLVTYMVDGQLYSIVDPPAFIAEYSFGDRTREANIVFYNPEKPNEAIVDPDPLNPPLLIALNILMIGAMYVVVQYFRGRLSLPWLDRILLGSTSKKTRRLNADPRTKSAIGEAARACTTLVKQHSTGGSGTLYFAQSEHYCDSFIEYVRDRNGAVTSVNIGMTIRPRAGAKWLGYSVMIDCLEGEPRLQDIREWYGGGADRAVISSDIPPTLKHVVQLCRTPLSSNNAKPPQESPGDMY